jgi:FAD/FMN-containing dehydrogenase
MATEQQTSRDERSRAGRAETRDSVLLQPGDEGYEEARIIHNAAFQRRPRFILQAASPEDVAWGIAFARERGLAIAVRSGGHSIAGHGSSDDLVIDLRRMRRLDVDLHTGTVRVGTGLTWGEMSRELHAHGLAVPSGDTGSVGIGGLTTGGGIGWLVRKYGLTIDSLISVEIVTADGRCLRAAADENSDLFWAVRGGGGNFGIVTTFEFQAHPVGTIIGGAVIYDAAEARQVLSGWARYAAEASEDLSTIVFIMHAPPLPFIPAEVVGTRIIAIGVCCVGDVEAGGRIVEPLRRLGTPVADITGPAPYPAVYALTEQVGVPGFHSDVRSALLPGFSNDVLEGSLRHIDSMKPPMDLLQLRVLGGAMERVPADATAFVHRDKELMATAISLWTNPGEAPLRRAWTKSFLRDIQPSAAGVYVNFLGDEGAERVLDAYGSETYNRLAALKRRYDPSNIFQLNQNILPARAS